ncbi:MAG: hypothetical protein R6X08_04170 [Desulfosalsimonadaceae bacterium]
MLIGKILLPGLLAAAALLLFSGCGKKAPPHPPTEINLPEIRDLEATQEDGRLTLTWPMPDWETPVGVRIAKFFVYRAKVDADEACEGCPVAFRRVGRVGVDDMNAAFGLDLHYAEDLEKGFHYRYKVAPYTNTGLEGSASNIVRLNY